MKQSSLFAITLVGNSSLLKDGIARILDSADFHLGASVTCAEDFIGSKVDQHQALLLIVHTGDHFASVADQIAMLRRGNPGRRIAVMADRYRTEELVAAFRAGANGYFAEVMAPDVFIKSIELLMMGETVLPPACLPFILGPAAAAALRGEIEDGSSPSGGKPLSKPADSTDVSDTNAEPKTDAPPVEVRPVGPDGGDPVPDLSPRESLILRWLVEGDSNKSIARKIDIAEATVKVHVKAILRKIRVHNRTQAAIWAMSNGWLAKWRNGETPFLPKVVARKRLPVSPDIGRARDLGRGPVESRRLEVPFAHNGTPVGNSVIRLRE